MTPGQFKQSADLLVESLIESHYNAARQNTQSISTSTFLNAYAGSGNVTQAIASALLTTGTMHAPLTSTRKVLDNFIATGDVYTARINQNSRFLGLGNSFFKNKIDPSFQQTYEKLSLFYELNQANNVLSLYVDKCNRQLNKVLYPNAAGITAAVCIACKLDTFSEISIFTTGRIKGWLALIH